MTFFVLVVESPALFYASIFLLCFAAINGTQVKLLIAGQSRSILELLNQKTRGFMVLIVSKQLFFERAHKVFGEMTVMT
jgi:hypothetical protein